MNENENVSTMNIDYFLPICEFCKTTKNMKSMEQDKQ